MLPLDFRSDIEFLDFTILPNKTFFTIFIVLLIDGLNLNLS